MKRTAQDLQRLRRRGRRPGFEPLEGRSLPSGIGFTSALGLQVSGASAAIHTNAVATDSAGDTYITGSFRGTVAFAPGSTSNTVTTAGTEDAFVAEYGPTGSLLWVRTFAGEVTQAAGGLTTDSTSQGSAIAVDSIGDVFVTGSFNGTVDLIGPSGKMRETSATSATEPFVARLDASGNANWFDAVAGTAYDTDSANALALDGTGGAVIAGSFADSVSFGTTTLVAGGSSEGFVARVNGSGTFLWAVASHGGNGSNVVVDGVAVDGSGKIDLAGSYSSTVDFDPSAGSALLSSAGSTDAFLWKLDSAGNFLWTRSYGSADYDAATAVAVDASGDLYATGAFSGTVNFGTPTRSDSLAAGPIFDTFLLKVDPAGTESWVKGLVGPIGSSKGQGVAVDSWGIVHLAGTFSGPIDFDPGPGTDLLASVGLADAFVAGYDPNGNMIYALQAGQTEFNAALGIAINPSGIVSITGTYWGSIAFGNSTLASSQVASVFVARVNTQVIPPAPSTPVLEASSDTGISQSDGITADTSPVFDVNGAIASDTLELLRNGVVVGQRIGPGAIADPGPLSDGIYTYTAAQVSPSGLVGPVGGATSITIRTAIPPTPAIPTLFASDDSGTIGDGITNVSLPRLSLFVNGGTTVDLINVAGSVIGSAYQAVDGTSLVAPYTPLPDGIDSIRAKFVDIAGNVGLPSPAFNLTIDTRPPAAPSALALLAADDSGTPGDKITNVRQPRLTGTAEPGSAVQAFDSVGVLRGSAVAAADGTFTLKLNAPLPDGAYQLAARAVDAAGNQGPAGPSMTLTILATAPPAPPAPSILAADVTGPAGSNLTNVRQPRITGIAKVGTTIALFTSAGSPLGSAAVGADGTYTIKVASPLADGRVIVDAIAVDVAGNLGPASSTLALTIDGTPPAAPSALALLAADDSGTPGDKITNVRQPRLTGTAEPGSAVQAFDSVGVLRGSAVAAADGTFTLKLNAPLPDGAYQLAARAVDAAGNQGPAGPSMILTILATAPPAPPAPSILAADDSGGPGLTNVRSPRLTGKTVANASVQLIGPSGTTLASTISSADGSYTAGLTSPLADGTYSIHAIAVDAAGNVSPPGLSFSLTILATPPISPSAPSLLAADDSGTVGDRITNIRQPRLTATAPPNLAVRLVNASGVVEGTATASARGSVTVAPTSPLADGTYSLALVAVDAAGNISNAGTSISLTILATPPPAPVVPGLLAADDTGVAGDGMTSVRRPRIAGVASPGGRVDWVGANGSVVSSTTASPSNGSYQLQPPTALPNGIATAKVRVTDVAGNVSPLSPSFNLSIRFDPGDDFGDSTTDVSVFRTADAVFFVQKPTTGALFTLQFGGAKDVPINGDFFGNGHNDIAVYRPSTSTFYIEDPVTNAFKAIQFGQPGDVPVPADFDGDGQADIAVYRPSTSSYLIQMSTTGQVATRQFGGPGDIPVPADYLGNGHADVAVYRPSNATFYASDLITGGTRVATVGGTNSIPVPADYEGIGRVDPAVYQPANSTYVILWSTNVSVNHQFGGTGDIPVPGDYLGDGRADLAVFRPSTSVFYALDLTTSASKVIQWGTPYATWPTLAPITQWFSFGGSPSPGSIIRPGSSDQGSSPSTPEFMDIPAPFQALVVSSVLPTRREKLGTVLDLESWRLDG